MSSIWTFSPSSEPYFQRCVAAAPPTDANKWYQKFGQAQQPDPPIKNEKPAVYSDNNSNPEDVDIDETNTYETFLDCIESDSTVPVECVLRECTKHPKLASKMAEKLSVNKVEQIFNHIFSKDELDSSFIHEFLPAYIKQSYSRLCNDLLINLTKHEDIFKKLLVILINDMEIPDLVISNYVSSLDEQSVTNFVINLSTLEITSDGLRKNLFAIYTAYKRCIKCDQTQEYVQKLLIEQSEVCSSDRTFGRLFLIYLQTEKSMDRKCCVEILEKCVESVISPFKRQCITLLKEL